MSIVTLRVADRDLPLRLTMRRVRLLREFTGVDILNDGGAQLGDPSKITGCLYALAGGSATGFSFEEFEDELTIADLASAAPLIGAVFSRDSGGTAVVADSGNVSADAPASKSSKLPGASA